MGAKSVNATKGSTEKKPKNEWAFVPEEKAPVFDNGVIKVAYGHLLRNGRPSGGSYLYFLKKDDNGNETSIGKFKPDDCESLSKAFEAAAKWMSE